MSSFLSFVLLFTFSKQNSRIIVRNYFMSLFNSIVVLKRYENAAGIVLGFHVYRCPMWKHIISTKKYIHARKGFRMTTQNRLAFRK